jgi:general stress protein YciG
MNRTKQREIASKGGKAAHAKGTAHEWSREQARKAGRKGGLAARRKKPPVVPPAAATPESQVPEVTSGPHSRSSLRAADTRSR